MTTINYVFNVAMIGSNGNKPLANWDITEDTLIQIHNTLDNAIKRLEELIKK